MINHSGLIHFMFIILSFRIGEIAVNRVVMVHVDDDVSIQMDLDVISLHRCCQPT